MELSADLRFDVPAARRILETLAREAPETPIVLTIGELGTGGLEAESDIRLRVEEGAALLATVGDDQRLRVRSREYVVLRVTRADESDRPRCGMMSHE